jgi:hypothetical protein
VASKAKPVSQAQLAFLGLLAFPAQQEQQDKLVFLARLAPLVLSG